jgi:hypothetical protein
MQLPARNTKTEHCGIAHAFGVGNHDLVRRAFGTAGTATTRWRLRKYVARATQNRRLRHREWLHQERERASLELDRTTSSHVVTAKTGTQSLSDS